MKHHLVLGLGLAGCNQVFGTSPPKSAPAIDAQQFDAPADAPYRCPALGEVPVFSSHFNQAIATGDCIGYSRGASGDLAVAMCSSTLGPTNTFIAQGPIDGPLVAAELVDPGGPFGYSGAALAPEADQLWATRQDGSTTTIAVFDRSPPTGWTYAYNAYALPAGDEAALPSPPTRGGSNRHLLYVTGDVHELAETAPGTWAEVQLYQAFTLGMRTIYDASLSPDGLRMVFSAMTIGPGAGIDVVMYADRASVTDRFVGATRLEGPPSGGRAPFLTEDCARLYFSGLGSVFYVAQQ